MEESNVIENIIKDIDTTKVSDSTLDNIDNRFVVINNNFNNIIKSEFLKGDHGDNYVIKYAKFDESVEEYIFVDDIYYSVENNELSELSILSSEKLIGFVKEFFKINEDSTILIPNSLKIIYFNCIRKDDKNIAVSSLPITYYDEEFYDNIKNGSNVVGDVDDSCVLYWNVNKFDKMNSFPTIYFNNDIHEFCWQWNGIKTNIISKGPKGDNGKNGATYVGVGQIEDESTVNLTGFILWNEEENKFKEVSVDDIIDKKLDNGFNYPGEGDLIITFIQGEDSTTYISVSPLHIITNGEIRYIVNYNSSSCIQNLFDINALKSSMISLLDSPLCPGLFIPYSNNSDGSLSAHLLRNDNGDLRISPVKNIHGDALKYDSNKKMVLDYELITNSLKSTYITSTRSVVSDITIQERLNLNNPNIYYYKNVGNSPFQTYEKLLTYNKDTDTFEIIPNVLFKGGVNINNTSNGTGGGVGEEEIKNILNTEFNIQPGTIEGLTLRINENKTNISNLQINPEEIKASVISSIKTDDGFKEEISSLVITSDSITSTVRTEVEGLMGNYATKDSVSEIKQTVDNIDLSVKNTVRTEVEGLMGNYATNDSLSNYATKTHVQEEISKISIGDDITIESLERMIDERISNEGNIETLVNEYISSLKLDENYATLSSVETLKNDVEEQIEDINGSIVELTSNYTSIISGDLDKTTGLGLLLQKQSDELSDLNSNYNTLNNNFITLSSQYGSLSDKVGTLENNNISLTNKFNTLNTNFNNLGNTYVAQTKLDNAGLFLGNDNIIMWGNAIKIATTKEELENTENYTALFDNGKISAKLLQVNELQCYNKKRVSKMKTLVNGDFEFSNTSLNSYEIIGFSCPKSSSIKYINIDYSGSNGFNPNIPFSNAYCYPSNKLFMINNVYGISTIDEGVETTAVNTTTLDSYFNIILKDTDGYIWRTNGEVSTASGKMRMGKIYNINEINFIPLEEVQSFMDFDEGTIIRIATIDQTSYFTECIISLEKYEYIVEENESVPKTTINRNNGGEVIMYWPDGSVMNCKIIKTDGENIFGCVEYFFQKGVCNLSDVMQGYFKLDSLQYLKKVDYFRPELSFNISSRKLWTKTTQYTINELNNMTGGTEFGTINEWFNDLDSIYISDSKGIIKSLKDAQGDTITEKTIYSLSGNDTIISDGSDLRDYLYDINGKDIDGITINSVDNLHKYLSNCSNINKNVIYTPSSIGDHLLVLDYNEESDTKGNSKESITLIWYYFESNTIAPLIKGVKSITRMPKTTNNDEWDSIIKFPFIIQQ